MQKKAKKPKSEWKRWTDSDNPTDEEILAQWEGYVRDRAIFYANKNKLIDEQGLIEDLQQEGRMALIKLKPKDRKYNAYCERIVTWKVSREALRLSGRGQKGWARPHLSKKNKYFAHQIPTDLYEDIAESMHKHREDVNEDPILDKIVPGDESHEEAVHAKVTLDKLMENLDPEEKELLALYHGLGGVETMNLREIAELKGWTQEWVRQKLTKIEFKIAKKAGAVRGIQKQHNRKRLPGIGRKRPKSGIE